MELSGGAGGRCMGCSTPFPGEFFVWNACLESSGSSGSGTPVLRAQLVWNAYLESTRRGSSGVHTAGYYLWGVGVGVGRGV